MKKVMLMAACVAALVSCQSKGNQSDAALLDNGILTIVSNDSSAVAVYEGLLPAADGPGIQYVLSVDSIGPDGESDYTLIMNYIDANGPGKDQSFTSKGKSKTIQKKEKNKTKKLIQLTPNDGSESLFFELLNDSTLLLIGESMN